jgi:hypothetical protein
MFRKRLAVIFAVLVVVIAYLTGCSSSSGLGDLHVLVLGDQGPLDGAKVISQTQPDGQLKVTGITQSDGTVTYRRIKTGDYTFYVSRFDYQQKEFTVSVSAGRITELTVTMGPVSPSSLILSVDCPVPEKRVYLKMDE